MTEFKIKENQHLDNVQKFKHIAVLTTISIHTISIISFSNVSYLYIFRYIAGN